MDALTIKGLRKTYQGNVEALKGVDLAVAEGDFFALLGANGAGKTTLINIVVSLVTKSAGTVSVFGIDRDADPDGAKALVGVVPQEFNFSIFETPKEIVSTQGGYYGMARRDALARTEELLKELGLWEKRRLMIARALVHRPKLLILDEPTAGVDVELRRGMWDYLKKLNAEGTTILLTTHYLEEVEQLCRNMVIIQKGTVVKAGSVRGLLSEAQGRRYRLTLAAEPTEAQAKAIGAESVHGAEVIVPLQGGDALDQVFAKAHAAGAHVRDAVPAQNRLEELYLSTLS